jgi:bifunctional DNase/RNase
MIPVQVHGIAVTSEESSPVLLLREDGGDRRWLAITVGAPEAQALISAQKGAAQARPSTIELIGHVLEAFGRRLVSVEVTALHDQIFLSDLVLDSGERISARPSDAVALALRADAPVSVEEEVLAEAAVEIQETDSLDPADEESASEVPDPGQHEQQIEDFRALLDGLTPDDFEDPPGGDK